MTTRIPRNPSSAYGLGEFINNNGPMPMQEMLTRYAGTQSRESKQAGFRMALEYNWLRMSSDEVVSLTERARRHFSREEADKLDVVPPRVVNVYASGTLQSKYIQKHPDLRDDFYLMAASA